MSIAFIHSLLRNFVLYFGPIIIISSSLVLSIANVDIYKTALNQNNFYSQIASEFDKSKPPETKDLSIQDQFYNNIIWNNIDARLNSKEWLKKVTETNIDRSNTWITGQTQTFEPYLPLSDNTAIDTSKPNWWTNIQNTSSSAFTQLQDQAKKLNLPAFNLPSNLEQPKLPVDLNTLNPVFQVNQVWINIWNGLRGYYWQLQSLAWTAITLYSLTLIGLVLSSVFFGKNLFVELSIIARQLGINLVISTLFFILSTSAVFLAGAVIKSFIPSSFLVGNVVSIINWQIIWLIVSVMTPALIIGGILTAGGLVTSLFGFGKTSQ
jgi:hypothetical protein